MHSIVLRAAVALAPFSIMTACNSSVGSSSGEGTGSIPGVAETDDTVLLEFWATWCGPCKTFAPVIDAIAAERPSSVVVRRVDIDKEPALARRFQVRAVPTVVLVQRGEELGRFEGGRNKAAVERFIAEELAAAQASR